VQDALGVSLFERTRDLNRQTHGLMDGQRPARLRRTPTPESLVQCRGSGRCLDGSKRQWPGPPARIARYAFASDA
jgi:hypothetical protein